jgi:Putative peptidoglycan binding domain
MKRLAIAASVLLGSWALYGAGLAAPAARAQTSSSSASQPVHKTSTTKKRRRRTRREPMPKAPTADRISEIQDALARNGCYDGEQTGKWDASTVAAMRKFQQDHGLDGTGKIDALTLQKLGLGSDIAGAFAPRPVTPRTTNPAPAGATPAPATPQAPKSPAGTAVTQAAPASVPAANPAAPAPAAPAASPATSAASTPKPTTPPQKQ